MKDCELCEQLVSDRDYREHKRQCYEQLRATVSNDTQTTDDRTNDASELQFALLDYDQWENNTEYDYGDLDQTLQDGQPDNEDNIDENSFEYIPSDSSDDESIVSEDELFETYLNSSDTNNSSNAPNLQEVCHQQGQIQRSISSSDRRVFKIVKPIASLTRALKQSVKLYKIIKSNNITRKAHRELVKFFNDLLGEANLGMYFYGLEYQLVFFSSVYTVMI
ncbi:hypothetical protein INT45_002559 [Circinella minor]|uniref:Uncharacterized protein n=1 Tax=Circinella minor TaxID=1195481 RepID=A0A8H7VBE6_9FUNG|nr:hypothetical protein INT45_002559 [Circinella minor]